MLQTRWLKSVIIPFAVLTAAIASGSSAHAQVKPFKVVGGGVANYIPVVTNVPVFHWAIGEATELGWYYAEGKFQLLQFTSQTTAEFDSAVPCVFTAANGDKLVFTYGDTNNGAAHAGEVELYPLPSGEFIGVFIAEFNPIPAKCTGKFKKVIDGSFTMTAITEPFVLGATDPVAYSWTGDGWIEYGKGK